MVRNAMRRNGMATQTATLADVEEELRLIPDRVRDAMLEGDAEAIRKLRRREEDLRAQSFAMRVRQARDLAAHYRGLLEAEQERTPALFEERNRTWQAFEEARRAHEAADAAHRQSVGNARMLTQKVAAADRELEEMLTAAHRQAGATGAVA